MLLAFVKNWKHKRFVRLHLGFCQYLLFVITIVGLSDCSSVDKKKNTADYDSPVELVTHKLKTHTDSALMLSSELQNVSVALRYFRLWEQLNDCLKTSRQRETILKYQTMYESQVIQPKVHVMGNEIKFRRGGHWYVHHKSIDRHGHIAT